MIKGEDAGIAFGSNVYALRRQLLNPPPTLYYSQLKGSF